MKILKTSSLLIIGLLVSSNAMSQKLSLSEYYSEYMSTDKAQTVIAQSTNKTKTEKLLLSEYYADYCADNDTPLKVKLHPPLTSKTEPGKTCNNHYAEHLK